MIPLKILFFILQILLLSLQSIGQISEQHQQDSLVFQKKKNHSKQIKLPLNDYYVLLKPINGKIKDVIITKYTDSTLIVKIYSFKKGEEKKAKKQQLLKIYSDVSLTLNQIDSLEKIVMYSILDTINLNQVDKIKIPNFYRSEMKRKTNIANVTLLSCLIVGIPSIQLFKSNLYFMIWNISLMVTVAIIQENKTLDLDQWEIVR